MEVPIRNIRGEAIDTAQLDERVWDITPNVAVLHQAVVAQQANARRGTADTRTRGEVRGSTRKHHRQKGTGLARQGSVRAPHWRGGGVVFGPHPRDWHQALPKKMRRLAMRSALSAKVDDEALVLVESWQLPAAKTKEMLRALAALDVTRGALVVLPEPDEMIARASSNIPRVRVVTPNTLNLLDVLKADLLIFTPAAAEVVTEQLLRPVRPKKTASLMSAPRVRTVRSKGVKKGRTASAARDGAVAGEPAVAAAEPEEKSG